MRERINQVRARIENQQAQNAQNASSAFSGWSDSKTEQQILDQAAFSELENSQHRIDCLRLSLEFSPWRARESDPLRLIFRGNEHELLSRDGFEWKLKLRIRNSKLQRLAVDLYNQVWLECKEHAIVENRAWKVDEKLFLRLLRPTSRCCSVLVCEASTIFCKTWSASSRIV